MECRNDTGSTRPAKSTAYRRMALGRSCLEKLGWNHTISSGYFSFWSESIQRWWGAFSGPPATLFPTLALVAAFRPGQCCISSKFAFLILLLHMMQHLPARIHLEKEEDATRCPLFCLNRKWRLAWKYHTRSIIGDHRAARESLPSITESRRIMYKNRTGFRSRYLLFLGFHHVIMGRA
jgi:hypothetical protein